VTDTFDFDAPADTLPDDDAESLVRLALTVVNQAKAMPLSASVLISREEVAGLLEDALAKLPDDLRQARWLLREREEFLAERTREAENLMAEVKVQAERMVARTEIVRQANLVAQRILDDANAEARRMRNEAEDYCDRQLAGMEIVLERIMRTVRSGRAKLQPAPVADGGDAPGGDGGPGAGPGSGGPGGAGIPDVGDDGFFDQDLA
jgi:hypothetical protein